VTIRNEEGFEIESLLSHFSDSRHKIYITVIFTHVVLEILKNKNLRYSFKATLTLETRIGYICNTRGYQDVCDGPEMKLT